MKQVLASLVLGMVIGVGFYRYEFPNKTIIQTTTDTKTITIEKPVLTEREVTKIIKDPSDRIALKQLMDKNKALQTQVDSLVLANATLVTKGGTDEGGKIEIQPDMKVRTYRDYQLTATFSTEFFTYILEQKFKIVSTTGRDSDGNKVGLIGLFQVTPHGLTNIPAQTTAIFADQAVPRWRVSPRVQAGLAQLDNAAGGVVAFQWLKHGKSTAAEDVRWGALSPAMFLGKETKEVGVLPVSFNLGTIKHIPLTNLWVSPYISQKHLGVAITATF